MKIYKSFASKSVRDNYVCKTQINMNLLKELNLDEFVSISEVKDVFDKLSRDKDKSIVVEVGSAYDKTKRKKTKYVKKSVLYQEVISHFL